jgi:2-polyprenyl-3-methyl-5-hydroxy-6-metoxy-1,4-benzoquinol methylase
MIYEALNEPVVGEIPLSATRVLDVGCGSGALGQVLKARQVCRVVGVTHSLEEAVRARAVLDEVRVVNLDQFSWTPPSDIYDVIICSHVLEHLREPADLLRGLRAVSAIGTVLIVALPNVLQWRQRLAFVRGNFRYEDGGLMDRTHLRFFDWSTATELIESAGWRIKRRTAHGHVPMIWRVPFLGRGIDQLANRLAPGLAGEQFVLVATTEE